MEEVMKTFTPKEKDTCYCPSCGKKVPVDRACCKCGASMLRKQRMSIKKIHLVVGIIGLIGIALMAYGVYESTRITPIADLNANMEGQTVRISGKVISIDYDSRYEKTSFTVNDSTGSIDCFGWSDFTNSLKNADALPSIGDSIIVEGRVNVYNSSYGNLILSIELEDYNSYNVIWEKSKKKDIGDVLLNDLNTKVKIQGNITERYAPSSESDYEYMFLDVRDNTGEITVYISGSLFSIAGERAVDPEVGDNVKITGWVSYYKGEIELLPSNVSKGAIKIMGE